jgi:D-alanine--poly(phosphoribitol) ligase subunit 1
MFTEFILIPFIDAADKFIDRYAFCFNEKYQTYKEFTESIAKICVALQNEKITNKIIGIVANDDLETYASIFAVWMEGYAYVPLHPQQPIERSLEIIHQAEVSLVIDSSVVILFKNIKTIESKKLNLGKAVIQPKSISDDSLAYILFTSGSTGKPKGVPITRGNLGAFMKSFWEVGFEVNQNDRCLQCFDLTFDVSIQSFLVPLTKGACTYTIPHDQIKYSYVYGLLEDHKLTFGAMAPSMIRYLRPYFDEINIPSMRYNILTAEASSLDLTIEWSKCIPHAEIYDFYGPTEATIYCTYYKMTRGTVNKHHNGMLSIGKPMSGLSAVIIDDEKRILGQNQKGELCISGDQVTPGYWKNVGKIAESFFELKEDKLIKRYYRTGDVCYFDDSKDLMLIGRLDQQVKIQGFRVELGEIEYHARKFLNGHNAVALSFENRMDNVEIALFLEGEVQVANNIIDYLKIHLPYYMIPTKLISLEQFPLNANGKIDRNILKGRLQ